MVIAMCYPPCSVELIILALPNLEIVEDFGFVLPSIQLQIVLLSYCYHR